MSSATKAPGAEGAFPEAEQGEKALWYMHIQGPDDVHAAPDFWTGLAWAAELNTAIAEKAAKENWATDGNYPHTQAVVRRWTWSTTEHAAMLARELAERQEHAEKRAAALASAPAPSDPAGAGGDLGELERLSKAATPGPWAYRPEHLDDWGYIRSTAEGSGELKGEVVATTRGEGHNTHDAHRAAGTDPYEANGRYIVALVNAHRSGQFVASTPGQKGAGEEKTGATPLGSSSRPSDQAPAGLDLTGFDLSRGPFADFARDLEWRATKVEREAWDSRDNLAKSHGRADGLREAAGLARVRDRSSEAAETSGSAEGKSPADLSATPAQTPPSPPSATPEGDPPMTVEEARDILDPYFKQYSGGAQEALEFAKWMADRTADEEARNRFLATASRIELALRTLHAAGEVRHDQ